MQEHFPDDPIYIDVVISFEDFFRKEIFRLLLRD